MRFEGWSRAALALVLLAPGVAGLRLQAQPGATDGTLQRTSGNTDPNSPEAQAQHYLVLICLDGFRWDYASRDGATHLLALGKAGVWAPEGMLPSIPALGLPNRFTIVTGLYPGHHGLVAGSFYDPDRKMRFSAENAKELADGSWYGGVPLWSLAESQGMRTAVVGWVGSNAKIAGFRPNYFAESGSGATARGSIDHVLRWLHLPEAERPHFIAVDLPEPSAAARRFGPDASETKAAAVRADALVGRLKAELDATGLPVDLVVISDRGMAKTEGGWITLDRFTSLAGFVTDGALVYGQTEEEREHVYRELNHVSSLFVVYRRKELPPNMHMNLNSRAGDPVVMATGPYAIRASGPAEGRMDASPPACVDGLDPEAQTAMKGIFFAAGPDIVPGKTVDVFENVNLYPWMAHILGLKAPKSDGSLNILAGTLRDDGGEPRGETKK